MEILLLFLLTPPQAPAPPQAPPIIHKVQSPRVQRAPCICDLEGVCACPNCRCNELLSPRVAPPAIQTPAFFFYQAPAAACSGGG